MSFSSSSPILRFRSVTAAKLGWILLGGALLVLLYGWTRFGLMFYERVIPFYDSLSYQDGYWSTTNRAAVEGIGRTLVKVWREPNNVVLYKFFGAALGGLAPSGKGGLYVYLYSIHFAALLALVLVTWRSSRSIAVGLWALAAWLSAIPFSQLRHGIVDQRMDLASAAFYLLIVALGLQWSRAPKWNRAAWFGLVAALAVLHRPVMVSSIVFGGAFFAFRAWLREPRSVRAWILDAAWMSGPGLLLAAPWLLAHASNLQRYYFVANVDVGNAPSIAAAAAYNGARFWAAFGPTYAILLVLGVAWIGLRQRIDWLDAAVIVAATVLPLATLAAARSSGNMLVCQLSLGAPALLFSCGRSPAKGRHSDTILPIFASALVLSLVMGSSFRSLSHELAGVRPESRREVIDLLRQITAKIPVGRVAAFQASPVDVVGLISISHELKCNLSVGTYAFHPSHFGIANEHVAALSASERQQAARRALDVVKRSDTILLLPTVDTASLLLPLPFSHSLIPTMHEMAAADPSFVKVMRTGPVEGMRFDVFSIRKP